MLIAGHPHSLTDASDTWLWYLLLPSSANSGIQHLVFHKVLISEEFIHMATLRTLSFLVIVFFKIISAGTHWTTITCLFSMLFNSSLRNKFLPSPDLWPSTLHFPSIWDYFPPLFTSFPSLDAVIISQVHNCLFPFGPSPTKRLSTPCWPLGTRALQWKSHHRHLWLHCKFLNAGVQRALVLPGKPFAPQSPLQYFWAGIICLLRSSSFHSQQVSPVPALNNRAVCPCVNTGNAVLPPPRGQ
jgi:hypothetical protein